MSWLKSLHTQKQKRRSVLLIPLCHTKSVRTRPSTTTSETCPSIGDGGSPRRARTGRPIQHVSISVPSRADLWSPTAGTENHKYLPTSTTDTRLSTMKTIELKNDSKEPDVHAGRHSSSSPKLTTRGLRQLAVTVECPSNRIMHSPNNPLSTGSVRLFGVVTKDSIRPSLGVSPGCLSVSVWEHLPMLLSVPSNRCSRRPSYQR